MENAEIIRIAKTKAKAWLNEAYDENTRKEVERMLAAPDTTELVDSFYNDLEFGTGGLRGIMGAGTNRMNRYTVGAATQGFANYINRMFPDKPHEPLYGGGGDPRVCQLYQPDVPGGRESCVHRA